MCKINRVFLPIGQGCFAVEFILGDPTKAVVYDCGTLTANPERWIKQCISTANLEGIDIEAVFISHVHEDHINGLELLIKYCNVKNVYLPLTLLEDAVFAVIVEHMRGGSKIGIQMITDPKIGLDEICKRLDKQTPELFLVSPDEELSEYNHLGVIASGHQISVNSENWVYVPYNFRAKTTIRLFEQELSNAGITKDYLLHNMTNSNVQKIAKGIYIKLNKNIHLNVMTLYAGPIDKDQTYTTYWMHRECVDCDSFSGFENTGCLYLGDYEAKNDVAWAELKAKYSYYLPQVGTIQVPHHGSTYNFTDDMLNIANIFVICAGIGHQHPHSDVVKKIHNSKRACLFQVCEDCNSLLSFLIS